MLWTTYVRGVYVAQRDLLSDDNSLLLKGDAIVAYAEALNTLDFHAPRDLPPQQKDLLFCMMDRSWKLIYHRDSPDNTELYNLEADPGETLNVADRYPEQTARLLARLESSGAIEIEVVQPDEPLDPEALERLRSLGYIGN